MAYGDFKNLPRRTASDKMLRDKAFNIAKNPKYDGFERGFASIVCKLFDKKSSGSAITRAWLKTLDTQDKSDFKNKIKSHQELAEELGKPIIRKFEKRKVH